MEPRGEVVAGNRIFAHFGVLDAYGHVSIRDPENPGRFIMSRARAPELVDETDLQTFDMAGNVVGDDKRQPYSERYIHAAIYESRPDVGSICHSHTPSIIPFGVTGIPLRPVYHMAWSIGLHVPVWDIAKDFGATNMLVTDMDQGRSLARGLGDAAVVLMRGHGCVFVGKTVPEVVRNGVYLDLNARLATTAHLMSNGNVQYLSDEEISTRTQYPTERAGGTQTTPDGGGREWEAWCLQVGIQP